MSFSKRSSTLKIISQAKHAARVAALWREFGDVFGENWFSAEGEIFNSGGDYSENFLLWCRQTQDLTGGEWSRGLRMVRAGALEAVRMGEDLCPPSYAAFLAACERSGVPAYRYAEQACDEDKLSREVRLQYGRERLAELRQNLFG